MHPPFAHQVFQERGVKEIDGRAFIKTLGGLAGRGACVKDEDGFELHEKRFGGLTFFQKKKGKGLRRNCI